jgi:signal transduction histidine kinase
MRTRARFRTTPATPSVVRQAVVRFVVCSLVALTVLVLGSVWASNRVAHHEAQRDAKVRGQGIARGVAAPLLTDGVRAGDPEATNLLAEAMTDRMREGTLSHVKIWEPDGTVIWADDPTIIGRRFELPGQIRRLFGSTEVSATSTAHTRDKGPERTTGPFNEVYVGMFDAEGLPIVFETGISHERLQVDQRAILGAILPLGIGALVLFQIVLLPLALSLARRAQRHEAERAKLLSWALMASDLERRRMAEEMHDVVLHKLAAVGYALPVLADSGSGLDPRTAKATVSRAESLLQEGMQSLRAVLADIYPPDLRDGADLRGALEDLAENAAQSSVTVTVDIPREVHMQTDAARLVYRIVREGVRNVLRHSQAQHAWVRVSAHGDVVDVRVEDDGRGVGADAMPGHLGIRLLSDTVQDLGGDLELRKREHGGSVLQATFPKVLV